MGVKGGVYTIPCKVNGLPLSFIFDTGASDVTISLTEALFMLKNGYLSNNDILGKASYQTADGNISEGTVINLKIIEIEGLVLNNVSASIVHQQNAPLLLGMSAIGKLGRIQLAGNELLIFKDSDINRFVSKEPAESINENIEKYNKIALNFYHEKKYLEAAPKFQEVYDLLRVAGQDNKKYLYYTGLCYALGDRKEKAAVIYMELLNSGYTGVETTYTARNKKSNEVENLDKATWEKYKESVVSKVYTDFKKETSKSIEQELYETTAALLIDTGKAEESLSLIEKGLKKFPASSKLSELQGNAYYKSGKTNEFVNNLKAQLAKNPNDPNNWYNLGVLQSKDPATEADALASYKKAIELKPDFAQAYQNLTYMTMGDDAKAIDDYNAARKAGKTEQANKIIEARRARLAATLPYAEKWYKYDQNNIDAVTLLKGLYLSTKNDVKFKEFKAKEDAMNASQK